MPDFRTVDCAAVIKMAARWDRMSIMRRQDKEIKDREAIEAVIRRARVCRIAMCDGDVPYVVPMSFGYRDGCVWLHCAAEGRKIDILRVNDRVCFEVDLDHATNRGEESCGWNLRYRSVIGFGRARIVEEEAGKLVHRP